VTSSFRIGILVQYFSQFHICQGCGRRNYTKQICTDK